MTNDIKIDWYWQQSDALDELNIKFYIQKALKVCNKLLDESL